MMKKIVLLFMCIALAHVVSAALITVPTSHTPKLTCIVQNAPCSQGVVDLLHLSGRTIAYAEVPTSNTFPYHLCCSGVPGLTRSCSGPFETVLKLSRQTNALAAVPNSSTGYPVDICLSAPTGISCVVDDAPPSPDYGCVIGIYPFTYPYVDTLLVECAVPGLVEIFCKILPKQRIPKYWHEAFGSQYPNFGQGYASINDTYTVGKKIGRNVVVIQDTIFNKYGIVSDSYSVRQSSSVTASVNASCRIGTAVLEIEFWDNQGQRIGNSGLYKAETSTIARLVVNAVTPPDAVYSTVFLHTYNSASLSIDCGFDDVQLVFDDTAHPTLPLFRPYEGYDDDILANPLLKYVNPVLGGYSCCAEKQCWDGKQCVASMANDPMALPINNYRCIDGTWVSTPEKTDLAGETGFCPVDTQCLVSVNGKADYNNKVSKFYQSSREEDWPQCIGDKQFVLDNYCDAGVWTSRTKLLAQRLLDLVKEKGDPNKYTLYCDDYKSALVSTGDTALIEAIEGMPQHVIDASGADRVDPTSRSCFENFGGTDDLNPYCMNNFCVLKYFDNQANSKKIVVATSLNTHPGQILSLFNYPRTACDGKGKNGFDMCAGVGTTASVWIDNRTTLLLYSRDGITLQPASPLQSFFAAITGLLKSIISFFTGTQALSNADVTFIESTTQFDRLYLNAAGTKRIIAVQETRSDKTFILAQYLGFTENLCDYVERISTTGLGVGTAVTCSQAGGIVTIYTEDTDVVKLWQEFTSKLRP